MRIFTVKQRSTVECLRQALAGSCNPGFGDKPVVLQKTDEYYGEKPVHRSLGNGVVTESVPSCGVGAPCLHGGGVPRFQRLFKGRLFRQALTNVTFGLGEQPL